MRVFGEVSLLGVTLLLASRISDFCFISPDHKLSLYDCQKITAESLMFGAKKM